MVLPLELSERNSSVNNSFEPSMYDTSGYIVKPGLNLIHALHVSLLKLVLTVPITMKLSSVVLGKFIS